jgi:hypothetical protein
MQNALTVGSAVFLTACSPGQLAWESEKMLDGQYLQSGDFTTAVIGKLPQSVSNENVTHSTLIDILPHLPRQTPCCLGSHEHRYIFTDHLDDTAEGKFACFSHNGILYITAGDIHGVVPGTIFKPISATYTYRFKVSGQVTMNHCRVILVSDPSEISSSLKLPVTIESLVPELKRRMLCEFNPLIGESPDNQPPQSIVKSDLKVVVQSGSVQLKRSDLLMSMFCPVIEPINFESIARFNHYLYHQPTDQLKLKSSGTELPVRVLIKELELGEAPYDPLNPYAVQQYSPTRESKDIFVTTNDIADYVAEAKVSPSKIYGFQIENHSQSELYVYLFYFDPAKYSIKVCNFFMAVSVPLFIFRHSTFLHIQSLRKIQIHLITFAKLLTRQNQAGIRTSFPCLKVWKGIVAF